jgi:hypothetical protein
MTGVVRSIKQVCCLVVLICKMQARSTVVLLFDPPYVDERSLIYVDEYTVWLNHLHASPCSRPKGPHLSWLAPRLVERRSFAAAGG